MNAFVFHCVVLLCMVTTWVSCVHASSDIDILKQILENDDISSNPDQQLQTSNDDNKKLDRLMEVIKGLLKSHQTPRRGKRLFCNSYCGCGNCKKRNARNQIRKRVPVISQDAQPSKEKRLFCNPWGCSNKRDTNQKSTMFSKLINTLRNSDDSEELMERINSFQTGDDSSNPLLKRLEGVQDADLIESLQSYEVPRK